MNTETSATVEKTTAPQPAHKHTGTSSSPIWATGRRKTSIARVKMVPGKDGKVLVNEQSVDDYFRGNRRQAMISMQSLRLAKLGGYDLFISVQGGGINGQAEAIRHGIARALIAWDVKLKMPLRKAGYLTRDPRAVERKKSGQPKARKRFQYSKR